MRRSRRFHRSALAHVRSFTNPESPALVPESSPLESDLASLRRDKLDFYAQLFEAAQIQRRLSGPRNLRRGEIQFASEVFAARYLSGDFVSVSHERTHVCVALGDIAGKGLAAGMWFTNLVGLLHRYSDCDPGTVASEINRHLCCLRPGAPFVTMFLAQIDTVRNEVTYCNAGHFPPLLMRATGTCEKLDRGGPLLGALRDARYECARFTLKPGDALVAYSDGLIECRNSNDEEFGMDNLAAEARRAAQYSAQATLLSLLASVQDFANGSPLCDDLSLMVIQRDAACARAA